MSRTCLAVRLAALILATTGLLTLGYAAHVVVGAQAFQAFERARLDEGARLDAGASPAAAHVPVEGDPVGEIQIDRLGLRAMVVHGDSAELLQRAVGHLPGTAWPGNEGNVVLAGHRDTFFRPLRGVRPGDAITISTPDGPFTYVVESTFVVTPTDLGVLEPTGGRTLTLITCFPFTYFGPAPDRFIVRAREADGPG